MQPKLMDRHTVAQPERALFYSHDTLGLGHLRRTLLICQELGRRFDNLSTLILTGSAMAHGFRMPPGVDYIKLPSVTKLENEVYESRSLAVTFREIWTLRQEVIFQSTVNYKPNLFFVDNVPLGMKGELRKTLTYIREHLPDTQVFLNLRDIVDSASHVVPLWRQLGVFDVLDRFYDRIFIYGQPVIFDPLAEYEVPACIRRKSLFCGYIPRFADRNRSHALRRDLGVGNEKLIVVTVGGGSDGALVVENYLAALPLISKQIRAVSVVVLGPEMNGEQARQFVARRRRSAIRWMDFCDDCLSYIDAADLVVSMGGYNTVNEILALRKRAIVIPRLHPRREQLIRSQRLHELGLLRMIHPRRLSPQLLAEEIRCCLVSEKPRPRLSLDLEGMDRLGNEIKLLLQQQALRAQPTARVEIVR